MENITNTELETEVIATDTEVMECESTTSPSGECIEPETINSNEIEILDRMKLEAQELDTKLNSIIEFINNNPKYAELSHTAGILLLEQRDVMAQYLDILTKRITLFVEENMTLAETTE